MIGAADIRIDEAFRGLFDFGEILRMPAKDVYDPNVTQLSPYTVLSGGCNARAGARMLSELSSVRLVGEVDPMQPALDQRLTLTDCPSHSTLEAPRSNGPLRITLNGEPHELDEPITVADLLLQLSIDPRRVAVEHNLSILKRQLFADTLVHNGDRIEIVNFVGGG